MYGKNLSYLYVIYGKGAYDLYVLYDSLGPERPSDSYLNPYGSNGYVQVPSLSTTCKQFSPKPLILNDSVVEFLCVIAD